MPWPQLIKENSPDIKSSHMLQSIFKHLLFLWASQLISQRLFSWRWRGWDTSSEPPGPSRLPPYAAWWKRWPKICPAPLLADERGPQAVGKIWKNEMTQKYRPAAWSPRKGRSGHNSSQSWHEIAHPSQSFEYMQLKDTSMVGHSKNDKPFLTFERSSPLSNSPNLARSKWKPGFHLSRQTASSST